MTDERPDPPRQIIAPERQFASTAEFQGTLIFHALVAGVIGVLAWKVTLGFGVMGADSVSDFYAIHIFYLVVFGMTPALNLLAAMHLGSRPARAKRYLNPALVFAWIQVSFGILFSVVAAVSGFLVPLFFAVLYALVVGIASKAASELETGNERGPSGGWRLAAFDLAAFTVVCAVLAIPVALFDNRYHVF